MLFFAHGIIVKINKMYEKELFKMKIDENKIQSILNKYDSTIRKAGAFLIELDENELLITDSCEGVDMNPLTKDLCLKLSDLFRELGENL